MKKIKWWNLSLGAGELFSLQDAFNNKFLSYGPIGAEFERLLESHLSVKHALVSTSGSSALLIALKALGIKPGDEVIVPNRTFQATANAADFLGATVKLADVDPATGLLTASTLQKVLTPKTKAVIVVHLNGRAVDLDPILKLKEQFSFSLIEDTAQAFNSKYKGKFLGTIGDIGCFSTGATKYISTGQGGFVTTNNSAHFQEMKNYLLHGMSGSDDKRFDQPGFNFRQADLLSSLAISQFATLERKTESFLKVYQYYKEGLENLTCLKLFPSRLTEGEIPTWVEILTPHRNQLFEFLKAKGIETAKFYPSLHRSTHLRSPESQSFPHSLIFEEQGLVLPCGPDISPEDMSVVISALHEFQSTVQQILSPKKILIGIQEGSCNLQCPKCYTHGTTFLSPNTRPKGIMDFEKFKTILDEAMSFNPRIAPQTWDEPFINPRLMEYLWEIKKRNLSITMDTNGLLMNEAHMRELIEMKADSIFISVDAFHAETYKKVRGVNKLEELKKTIHRFLEIRGENLFPRIGVSFVTEEDNAGEVQDFVQYWSEIVDVVRVNEMFQEKRGLKQKPTSKRTPCWSLQDSLMIHNNGEAALCCVDTHYENKIGNVFDKGLLGIWNGAFFNETRKAHEKGNFNFVSICAKCDLWSHEEPVNHKTETLLISETTTHKYFNRLDRLESVIKNNRFI